MTTRNIKYYIIALAILFGLSPFISKTLAIRSIPNILLAIDDNQQDEDDDEEDEDDEDEDDEEDDEDEEDEDEDEDDENDEEDNDSIYNNNDEIIITDKDGHEDIIEVPGGMSADLDEMMQQYNAQQYLQPDTTCRMSNENPTYPQEVYMDRLKRMPTAIEMPWNDVVQKFIDRYSGRLRRSISYMLGASNFYMPIFEQALEVYGLPLELKYLPVIESALNPNAVSPVGAGGLWQFMNATGKRYGLKINSMIDERRDAVKSSYAAAHFLSDLYNIYGDWSLVIAAYNCGPGNINKAIQRSGGKRDYWEIYPYLPSETRGYVPAFIAANYIMTYYCEHNICPMLTTLPVQTDTIMLFKNLHFEQVSQVLGIDIKELRALNPQYRRDIVTGYSEPTDLRLPIEYISKFIELEDSIFAYDASSLMKRDLVEVNDGPGYTARKPVKYTRKYTRSHKRVTKAKSKRGKKAAKVRSTKKKKNTRGKAAKASKSKKRTAKKAATKKRTSKKRRR